jgi:hypothetical protein
LADNVVTNPGAGGATFASDDIAGIQYPRVKVTFGDDGAAVDASATNPLPIVLTSAQIATLQASLDTTSSGTITGASQNVAHALVGKSGVAIQITGVWVGTLQFEGTVDGTNWVAINGVVAGTSTPGPTTTANGVVRLTPSGLAQVRIFSTAWTSGTATINFRASDATGGTFLNQSLTAGANIIGKVGIDQTTPGTTNGVVVTTALPTGANAIGSITNTSFIATQATPANLQMSATQVVGSAATRWFAQISDGTNSPAVKAASTAAAATDPALVVSIAGANAAIKIGDGTNNAAIKAASTAAAFTDPALTADVRPGGALVTASAALADGLANPTLGQQAVLPSLFNGTTWDRQRGMGGNLTTGDTGAKTATGNGATITNIGNKGIQIVLNMGAVTGTTPTFVLKVQSSVDGGTNWVDVPGATTASLVATGIFGISIYPGQAVTAGTTTTGTIATASGILPRTWRVVWTIGGTTPSFTITTISYNYIPN